MFFARELSFPLSTAATATAAAAVDEIVVIGATGKNHPPLTGLSEIYGEAGSGKTQLCLTVLNDQMTKCIDHNDVDDDDYALYICTDHKFPSTRFMEIINDTTMVSDRVRVLHIFEADHLQCWLEQPHLDLHPPTLLIVDSIAAPFRYGPGRDQACLDACIRRLKELASLGTTVICTNQVSSVGGKEFIPCLGASWASAVDTRIQLRIHRGGEDGLRVQGRSLVLQKSPIAPPSIWTVRIDQTGLTLIDPGVVIQEQ